MDRWRNGPRLLPVTLVMGGIFYQSHQLGTSFSLPEIVNIDKLLHALVYAGLGLAFLYALPPPWRHRHPWLTMGTMVLFCLSYGVFDEWHQSFVPGRIASGADVAADVGGGFLVVIGNLGWRRWRKMKGDRGAP